MLVIFAQEIKSIILLNDLGIHHLYPRSVKMFKGFKGPIESKDSIPFVLTLNAKIVLPNISTRKY